MATKTVWWAFLGMGIAFAAKSVVSGLRAKRNSGEIIDDASQEGFLAVLALTYLLESEIAQTIAGAAALVIFGRGVWVAFASRSR